MENIDEQTTNPEQHAPLDDAFPMAITVGRNVTYLRKQAKITKHKFALMIGVGRPFLNRIENGTADPRLSVILRLAAALDTTPQELLVDHSDEQDVPADNSDHAKLH